jgi:O-antigen/teichoic acid export membrane protein
LAKNNLIKNWSYLLFSDISQAIVSFFVFMLLARKLSTENYGALNALMAIASLFSVFSIYFSANQLLTKDITLNPKSSKSTFTIFANVRILSFLLVAIVGSVIFLFNDDYEIQLLPSVLIITSALVIWDLAESIAFGHFVTKITTFLNITGSLTWLVVVLLLPYNSLSLITVIYSYSAIYIFRSIVYLIVVLRKHVVKNISEKTEKTVKGLVFQSLPFLWMRLIATFSSEIPLLILNENSGSAEVGYYSVGNRFVMPITLAVTTGMRALFPFLTKLYYDDQEKFRKKLDTGFSYIFIAGAIIAFLLTTTTEFWLTLLFGNKYSLAALPFNYLAWFGVVLSFDLLLSNVLVAANNQRLLATITTIDILIVFPLLFYGSNFGAEGMAKFKLIGVGICVFYHILVTVFFLKIQLNSIGFITSGLFFISLLIISFLNFPILIQVSVGTLLLVIFYFIPGSALGSIIDPLFDKGFYKLYLKDKLKK